MAIYKLQSADGQTFQIDGAILKQCGMLKYIKYEAGIKLFIRININILV